MMENRAATAQASSWRSELLVGLLRPWLGGRGSILCLHRIVPGGERSPFPANRAMELTPADLAAVLGWVRERGLAPIALDDLPGWLARRRADKFVCFTFDDGYRDNLELARPLFARFQMPFAVNVTVGFVGGGAVPWWYVADRLVRRAGPALRFATAGGERSWPLRDAAEQGRAFAELTGELRSLPAAARGPFLAAAAAAAGVDPEAVRRELMMTPAEVARLSADPLATIGAHTVTHPELSRLDEAGARAELAVARERLGEWIGRGDGVRHLAFPFGSRRAAGDREYRLARACGYVTALTTECANLRARDARDLHALPRLTLSGNYPALDRLAKLEAGLVTLRDRATRWWGAGGARG